LSGLKTATFDFSLPATSESNFNVDFNKHKLHSSLLSNFCDGNNLSVAANHRSCDIDYTYNFCVSRFSFIDHFILPRVLFETSIVSCVVTHDGDNLSDHDPITITLDIDLNCVASSSRCYLKRHAWYKAKACDIELYKLTLKGRLHAMQIPTSAISCHNVLCTDEEHKALLNDYSQAIIQACLASSASTIPYTADRSNNANDCNSTLPGWNEHVLPCRDKAIMWHNIWVDCGRPHDGIVADIMRRTRAVYHYAIRYVKRNRSDIIKQRFADAIVEDRNRDFWHEVKHVCGSRARVQNIVDGQSQASRIADLFADKYKE